MFDSFLGHLAGTTLIYLSTYYKNTFEQYLFIF